MMHDVLGELNPALPAFNKKKALFTRKLDLNLWKVLYMVLELGHLVHHKYLGRFEMCWRMMVKICCTDNARSEVLHRVKEERNI
jgi:hypothetical protein